MNARLAIWRRLGAEFLIWWRGELAALIPARWRARLAAHRAQTLIRLGEDHIEVERHHQGTVVRERADQPLHALDDDGWVDLARLCNEARAMLVLPSGQELGLSIDLPHGALARVDAALGFQLARHAPLDPAALVWTRSVTARSAKTTSLAVTLVRRDQAEAIQAQFAARGLACPAIISSGDVPPQILLAGEDASLTDAVRRNRRAAWIAAALIASIPLTSLALLAFQRSNVEARLTMLSSEASSAARAAANLQAASDGARVLQALARTPAATQALARPAAALPEGTVVTGAAVRRGASAALRLTLPAGLDPATTGLVVTDARPLPDGRIAAQVEAAR
jgi:general secretion pathway protein L